MNYKQENIADKLTAEQLKQIRKQSPNGVYVACVKTTYEDGRAHYSDLLLFDENKNHIDNIHASAIGLYSTI